jgi:hypothetical protein
MTHVYRVRFARKFVYFTDRGSSDRFAQTLADKTNETVAIERCRLFDKSRTSMAVTLLNGEDWCADHRILHYFKPRQQQRVA